MPLAEMFEASILEFWDLSEVCPSVQEKQGLYRDSRDCPRRGRSRNQASRTKHRYTADVSQKEEEELRVRHPATPGRDWRDESTSDLPGR